jgi:hypothetical protein
MDLDAPIAHRLPLAQAEAAFRVLDEGKTGRAIFE